MLLPGLATGIGSLPHTDPVEAADVVLRLLPELPAAPQLPERDPREGMLAQWLGALPEVTVAADGSYEVLGASDATPECHFDLVAHGGLHAFLDRAAAGPQPERIKVQLTGPLTLGSALEAQGVATQRTFRPRHALSRDWAAALEALVADAPSGHRPRGLLRRTHAGALAPG